MKAAILFGLTYCLSSYAQATDANLKQKDDQEDENTYISYDPKRSIKQILSDYPGDFGSDLF